jgi:hypothetical protein
MAAEFEIGVLKNGDIYIEMSGTSLDYHLPDPMVYEHFSPKEAYDIALEIMQCVINSGKLKDANQKKST